MELKTTDEEHVQPWNRSSNKRIEDSNRKKEKAKLLFQEKSFKEAGEYYINALRDIIPILEPEDEHEDEAICELKAALYSNLAACQSKLKQFTQVIRNCSKSLELNNSNVKCLYRRANAYLECKDTASAEKDIKQILVLEPENTAVRDLETRLSDLKVDADQRDAAVMRSFLTSSS